MSESVKYTQTSRENSYLIATTEHFNGQNNAKHDKVCSQNKPKLSTGNLKENDKNSWKDIFNFDLLQGFEP